MSTAVARPRGPIRAVLVAVLAAALAVLALGAARADAHAVLVSSQPEPDARLTSSPSEVRMQFSEPVQLLSAGDLDVVDERGTQVSQGEARQVPGDATSVEVGLRPDLPEGTYTTRFRIVSADSHIITGALVFGVGSAPLGQPYLGGPGGGGKGPSETSAWAVVARFLEIVGIGGLVGLLTFRWLVWRPAWMRAPEIPADQAGAALGWGRDTFWVAFGVLAVGAMLAEAWLLVVKSASALGTSVPGALGDPGGIARVLGDTRFGGILQLRAALLFVLFAVGVWQFLAEFGTEDAPRPAEAAGRLWPGMLMLALAVVALGSISYQGHASQAPWSRLQIPLDAVHGTCIAIWVGGLALVGLCLWRLPRVAGGGGRTIATVVLARFSSVAFVTVGLAVVTGVARAVGQLSDPSQLWDTAYGRSIIIKVVLLSPIGFLALRNRKVLAALRGVRRPNAATLRMVRRSVGAELLLAVVVIGIAALLVAQVPGRG